MSKIATAALSKRYAVRRLDVSDVELIYGLCESNPLFYASSAEGPSRGRIRADLEALPPGIPMAQKHYVGFFEGESLVAVMDLIDGYPEDTAAFIGFFMVDGARQGHGVGSAIIGEALGYLASLGFESVQLGIDEDNPQARAFWKKNGFEVVRRFPQEAGAILLAERKL